MACYKVVVNNLKNYIECGHIVIITMEGLIILHGHVPIFGHVHVSGHVHLHVMCNISDWYL